MNPAQNITNKVTAVITTVDRPVTLERAIQSVISQTVLPFEIIVVDNGGKSGTHDVITSYLGRSQIPIRCLREDNTGVSPARNRGIKDTTTDYVAFLDDDDIWAADHIELFLSHIITIPTLALYAGWTSRYSDKNHKPDFIRPELVREYRHQNHDDLLIHDKSELTTPFYTPSMSASILNTVIARQIFFDEQLHGREDIYFIWLLSELGEIVIHNRSHAYIDQLDVSLFSLPSSASILEQIDMNIKKAYWGVIMLEKIMRRVNSFNHPLMVGALKSAYFDYAYSNLQGHNIRKAIGYNIRSARLGIQIRHIKLLIRTLFSVVLPQKTTNR